MTHDTPHPTTPTPQELLELAVDAAQAAGALLLERFGGPASGVDAKSTRTDLVSDADRDAEALILGRIRAARPGDRVVAEESGESAPRDDDALTWCVDPLDGTVNYLWEIPHWCVSIQVAGAGGDLAAVVHDPCRDETFTAVLGRARLGDRDLVLTPSSDLGDALVGTGFAYSSARRARQAAVVARALPVVRDIRRAGSAALDLAWVAAGRLDAYYERGLAPWDWAAGSMLVSQSGGELVRLEGRDDDEPFGLLAARPGLTAELTRLVSDAPDT